MFYFFRNHRTMHFILANAEPGWDYTWSPLGAKCRLCQFQSSTRFRTPRETRWWSTHFDPIVSAQSAHVISGQNRCLIVIIIAILKPSWPGWGGGHAKNFRNIRWGGWVIFAETAGFFLGKKCIIWKKSSEIPRYSLKSGWKLHIFRQIQIFWDMTRSERHYFIVEFRY